MATRKNASPNPALKNDATGWGGGSTPTRSTGLSGLPRTTGAHYSANSYAQTPAAVAGPGETWTISLYFQNNTGSSLGSKTVYFVCQRSVGGDDFSITTSVALPTGVTRISFTATTLANTTGLYMLVDSFNAAIGGGCDLTAALFEKVGALDTYFDGDTAGAVWDGADGNSTSTLTTGSDVVIPDTSSGGGTAGQLDGLALGDGSGWAGTSGQLDGRAVGDGSAGGGTAGQLDGLALGDGSAGAGTGGQLDGLALSDGSGGAGTGGGPDTIIGPVTIVDASGGGGTGGSPDTVVSGRVVVHDVMVMPLLQNAKACLITEVGKLAFPPARVQIRPGATFEFQVDNVTNECCDGIAWVRRGTITPWPDPSEPTTAVNPPAARNVQLELGIMRCVPVAADETGANVTEAQWDQAAQNAEDDAAALRRAICCLRSIYGTRSVVENAIIPLENGGMCGGQIVTVTVRVNECDCVE